MATIVNTPAQTSDSGSGMGFFMGALLLILFAVLLFMYVIPRFTNSAPTINVPDQVDVNVNPGTGNTSGGQ